MAIPYEKILTEDLDVGTASADRTAPGGGTMTGTQINGASTIPQLTQAAIDLLSPTGIMMVFNTTTTQLNFYNGSAWTEINTGIL